MNRGDGDWMRVGVLLNFVYFKSLYNQVFEKQSSV